MFFWISESLAAPTQYYEAPSGLKLRGGETYLEAVWPGSVLGLGPEFHLVVYWIRMTDTDAFVGTLATILTLWRTSPQTRSSIVRSFAALPEPGRCSPSSLRRQGQMDARSGASSSSPPIQITARSRASSERTCAASTSTTPPGCSKVDLSRLLEESSTWAPRSWPSRSRHPCGRYPRFGMPSERNDGPTLKTAGSRDWTRSW